jgi:hypothetical protein
VLVFPVVEPGFWAELVDPSPTPSAGLGPEAAIEGVGLCPSVVIPSGGFGAGLGDGEDGGLVFGLGLGVGFGFGGICCGVGVRGMMTSLSPRPGKTRLTGGPVPLV